MIRLWWVRHGPTHQRVMTGWRDVPADLSDTAALSRLATFLPPQAVVISSDLQRARATADAIAAGRARLPDEPDFREFNFGDWEGQTFDELVASHPELSRIFWEEPGDIAPPGGESWNSLERRVSAGVERLRASRPATDIIAVAHFGVILTQLRRVLGVTPAKVLAQPIEPLSVTCLELDVGERRVLHVNHRA